MVFITIENRWNLGCWLVVCSRKNVSLGFGDLFSKTYELTWISPLPRWGLVLPDPSQGDVCPARPSEAASAAQPAASVGNLFPCWAGSLVNRGSSVCADTVQYRGTRASQQWTPVGMVTEAEKLSSPKFHMNTQLLFSPPCTLWSRWHSHGCLMPSKKQRALQLCTRKLSHLSKLLFHKTFTFLLWLPLP